MINVDIIVNNKEQSIPVFDKEVEIKSKNFDYSIFVSIIVISVILLTLIISLRFFMKYFKKIRKLNTVNSITISDIKNLIKENKTKQALYDLETYLKTIDRDLHNQVIMHQANYNSISQQSDLNTISFSDAKQSIAQINYR